MYSVINIASYIAALHVQNVINHNTKYYAQMIWLKFVLVCEMAIRREWILFSIKIVKYINY